jgi:protein TonB
MSSYQQTFRRNLIIVTLAHAALIAALCAFQHSLSRARDRAPIAVELITPAALLGQLPKGPGLGTGPYSPPAQAPPGPTEAIFTPEERPGPTPQPAATRSTDPGEVLIPKKTPPKNPAPTTQKTPKPATTAQPATTTKPGTTAKPATTAKSSTRTASASTAASAEQIRRRFERALAAAEPGGTPYGDGRTAGGGAATAGPYGSPDGSPDGLPGGIGKGSPYWWYYMHVHDKMYEAWQQPGTAAVAERRLVTTVVLRVARDGRIEAVRLQRSSGNRLMDDSALAAARSVPRLDPLPEGLGGAFADIVVNFRLEG